MFRSTLQRLGYFETKYLNLTQLNPTYEHS